MPGNQDELWFALNLGQAAFCLELAVDLDAATEGAMIRRAIGGSGQARFERDTMTTRTRRRLEDASQVLVATEAVKVLSDWLDSARFPIHSRLPPERKLAETLRISRGKVREALFQLETDGRIWRHVGMGTFVGCRPSSLRSTPEALGGATTLTEILEARAAIEPVVARLAATRAEASELTMIEKYHDLARKAATWSDWEQWDNFFHRAVAEASGNGILISTIDQLLRIKMHPRWTVKKAAAFDQGLVRRYSEEHVALLSAIANRDPEDAEAAMRRHMHGLSLTVGPIVTRRR